MARIHTITPCLWFKDEAEPAAELYTSIFPHSRIRQVTRYAETAHAVHGMRSGLAMAVAFDLGGQPFTAVNGSPGLRFNQAISLQITCASQAEVDHFWSGLSEGGDRRAQRCGWLTDRFGVCWQVIPDAAIEILASPDQVRRDRALAAMLRMKKLNIAALRRAFDK
jgi:predicted 3-demethylubiquinone-9 3-methyltransferase (glyoxalase superfamily)